MYASWIRLATDMSLLALESQGVIWTRLSQMAVGRGSARENLRMVSEKVSAASEAALTVAEHGLGWVVEPEDSAGLARAIRDASSADLASIGERAVVAAQRYNFADAMNSYAALMQKLLRKV